LAKESLDYVQKIPVGQLKSNGSVGEPINEEAWHWYNDHVGGKHCPLLILVANRNRRHHDLTYSLCYPYKANLRNLPLPGIQPVLMDEKRNEIDGNQVVGACALNFGQNC
jgi:acetyl-CoA synthetase